MSEFQQLWLQAFAITQLIEISAGILISRQFSYWKTAVFIFIASAITHPILWFIIYKWSIQQDWSYQGFLLVGEGYVWFVEGLFYKLCGFKHPFLFSFLLNVASFLIGFIIQQYGWLS